MRPPGSASSSGSGEECGAIGRFAIVGQRLRLRGHGGEICGCEELEPCKTHPLPPPRSPHVMYILGSLARCSHEGADHVSTSSQFASRQLAYPTEEVLRFQEVFLLRGRPQYLSSPTVGDMQKAAHARLPQDSARCAHSHSSLPDAA